MLKQRIITALVLAPAAILAILFLSVDAFQLVVAVVMGLGAYEWGNMSGLIQRRMKLVFTIIISAICVGLSLWVPASQIWLQGQLHDVFFWILAAASVWWAYSLMMVIIYPKASAFWQQSHLIRNLFGVFTLVPTYVAIVTLRSSLFDVDTFYGASLIFYVLGIVWAADVGAFFVGVKFGRTKLRPNVSPGKTYEGFAGGVAASLAIIAFAALHYQVEAKAISLHIAIGVVTVAVSALGDLNESMFKRCAGIKDSGRILPGHGGILDRIDSLTAAFPVFTFCYVVCMA
ncbi:MAG: phosphatidate cytidylyltransferase [Glaciecola sp.]|nr:phosphatidate cytidylyltransferase [Glaciecola sp.]